MQKNKQEAFCVFLIATIHLGLSAQMLCVFAGGCNSLSSDMYLHMHIHTSANKAEGKRLHSHLHIKFEKKNFFCIAYIFMLEIHQLSVSDNSGFSQHNSEVR